MPYPTIRQLRMSPATYPTFEICPKCRGDRGHMSFTDTVDDDTGITTGTDFALVECEYCFGDRFSPLPTA